MVWSKGAIIISLSVVAQPLLANQPIWRDIYAGMPVEEVRALYPEGKTPDTHVEHHKRNTELHGFVTIGQCKPRVEVFHKNGSVEGVVIWMRAQGAFRKMCADEARATLLAKYGEPLTRVDRKPSFSEPYEPNQEQMSWDDGTKAIKWVRRRPKDQWSITYIPARSLDVDQL